MVLLETQYIFFSFFEKETHRENLIIILKIAIKQRSYLFLNLQILSSFYKNYYANSILESVKNCLSTGIQKTDFRQFVVLFTFQQR